MDKTKQIEKLKELWTIRNPQHEYNASSGEDMFWGTVLCIFDDMNAALNLPGIMPRYFIDERSGCSAVRDREHPKYNKDYQGLHQDTPDVVVYAHGFQNHEKGCWEMKSTDINYIRMECDRLNSCNGA